MVQFFIQRLKLLVAAGELVVFFGELLAELLVLEGLLFQQFREMVNLKLGSLGWVVSVDNCLDRLDKWFVNLDIGFVNIVKTDIDKPSPVDLFSFEFSCFDTPVDGAFADFEVCSCLFN